ncbi:MAG: BACON domain-containing protein, partial [Prevotellaceae bacterium]|nr:BACON domain-containing protein [Prevotellaceae bacterium]
MPTAFNRHIALTFIAALLAACVNEPTDNFLPPPDTAPAAAPEAELLFRIAIPKNKEQAGTRAMTDADERTVTQLDVLAFAEDDDDVFRFAYYTAGGEATISNAGESRQTFKVKAGVMSVRQQFVIIANARDAVDAVVASMTGKSRDEALALLQINLSSGRFPAVSNKIETYMPIPMWGESSPVVIDNSSDEVVVSTGEDPIKLLRMTARIDVLIDETAEAQPNEVFQMTRVMVYNYHTDGHIVPGSAHLNRETMIATTATLPTAATPTRGPITFTASSPTACTQEIYILEADNSTAADKTCLVVGGRYEGDAADSYYRIDFVQTDDEGAPAYADVLRNHRYQFKITEVQGPGYATADEAFDHAPMNMKVEWYTWDQGAAEHIAFDKDTYLSVSRTDYLFNANESYSGMGAGDKNVVEVYSNHADGWHIKSIEDAAGDDATWLTLYEPTTPPALIANNAAQQGKKKLYFHFDDNATGADRTAVITFAAGRLENQVRVTQNGDIVAFVQLFHVADNVAGNVAGNEIADGSIITFDANTGDTPAAKSLMVRWSPGDSPVTVSVAYNAEKAHFVTATTNFTDGQVISGSTTGEVSKEETFVFDPPAIPDTAGEDERWHGREMTLTFSVGGVSRTVILRQVNYVATFSTGLPGVDNNIYLIDNENKAFYVRANFNWRVAISDGGGIIDEADGLISSTTGGVNTSLPQGRAVNFRFLDWSGQYDTDAIAHKDELPTTSTLTIYRITDDNVAGNDVVFSTHTIRGTPMRVRPVDGFLAGTNAVDSVPTLGGSSVAFDVEGKSNYVWKARLTMTAGKRTKDGEEYALVNHRVYLTDEYGTDIALTPTDLTMPYSASAQSPLVFETGSRNFSESFRVRYPMLYFPNREIPAITTVVRVYLVAGGQEIEMPVDMSQVSVGQQALTKQQRDKVWSPDGISGDAWPDTWGGCSAADAGWGSVRSYYMGTINEL